MSVGIDKDFVPSIKIKKKEVTTTTSTRKLIYELWEQRISQLYSDDSNFPGKGGTKTCVQISINS